MSPVDPAVRARAVLRSAARQAAHRTLISMNPWPLLGVGERDEALAATARRHHRRPRAAAVLTIVYVAVAEAIRSLLRDAGRTDASYWRVGGEQR